MPNLTILLSQAFNGLALGMLLALVSSGLTIVLGTLGVLNMAHGAMFMLGAYAIFVIAGASHSYLVGIVGGIAFTLVLGVATERLLVRWLYDRPHEDQLLATFGAAIVLTEATRIIFGSQSQHVATPGWGAGVIDLGFLIYPTYRLQLIGIIALLLLAFYLVLYRTSIGLIVRAGIENAGMVGVLGINVRRAFLAVFAIGVLAAGVAGMLYAPLVSVDPDMGAEFLVQSFVVIVIGGLGSYPGAVVGGIIAGEIISLTSAFNSAYSQVMLYVVMTLLLALRPQGLFGKAGRV